MQILCATIGASAGSSIKEDWEYDRNGLQGNLKGRKGKGTDRPAEKYPADRREGPDCKIICGRLCEYLLKKAVSVRGRRPAVRPFAWQCGGRGQRSLYFHRWSSGDGRSVLRRGTGRFKRPGLEKGLPGYGRNVSQKKRSGMVSVRSAWLPAEPSELLEAAQPVFSGQKHDYVSEFRPGRGGSHLYSV